MSFSQIEIQDMHCIIYQSIIIQSNLGIDTILKKEKDICIDSESPGSTDLEKYVIFCHHIWG